MDTKSVKLALEPVLDNFDSRSSKISQELQKLKKSEKLTEILVDFGLTQSPTTAISTFTFEQISTFKPDVLHL